MNQSRKFAWLLALVLLLLIATCSPDSEANSMERSDSGEPAGPGIEGSASPAGPVTAPVSTEAATYYVRSDGGSHDQCSGAVDVPYPGSGLNQECAWDHPFRALPPQGTARISAGDTLIITAGSYMMGYLAAGADACESDYAWDCFMSPVPSGSPGAPTRILGAGWSSGCPQPPELWGSERAVRVLNLDGSSYVEVACLEITDHAACAEDHSGGMACQRSAYPFGPWAESGLYAADSTNVSLRQLNIHGLAVHGVFAGRLTDWTVEDVRIAGNGLAGWDGDIEGDDGNGGTMTFRRTTVEWNGCVETYPGKQPAGCWGQSAGGYGDGLGTGETGGNWLFEESAFLHNTSDGLDLLYTRRAGSSVTVRRTISAGNAGDQIKTTGPTLVENVVAISNCGYFTGKPFTHDVDACRSGGSAIALEPRTGDQLSVINSTITGQGDCLVISVCGEGSVCDGTERILLQNSIFLGNPEFQGGGDQTCMAWSELNHDPFDYDHSIITNLKAMPDPCPAGSLCNLDPGLMNDSIDAFDAHLAGGSPAINAGTVTGAPADDFDGRLRDDRPDIGAYEWWEPSAWIFLPVAEST